MAKPIKARAPRVAKRSVRAATRAKIVKAKRVTRQPDGKVLRNPGRVRLGGGKPLKPAIDLADVGAKIFFVDRVEQAPAELGVFAECTAPAVRAKFVVVDRRDVPTVAAGELVTRHHVTLVAAYEAEPIHHGLGTIQGNRDNRVFGLGQPEATIAMVFTSKAVADVFLAGRGFAVDFTELDG